MTSKRIAEKYFADHPSKKDDVMKAYFAYHTPHFRETELEVHNFTNGARYSRCSWCGRTREMVRHDDLPATCQKRPNLKEIKEVVSEEEEKFQKLLKRGLTEIPRLVQKLGMTGEAIAKLHHTYGYDLETVMTIVEVSTNVQRDYWKNMEKEKIISQLDQKKKVVYVV